MPDGTAIRRSASPRSRSPRRPCGLGPAGSVLREATQTLPTHAMPTAVAPLASSTRPLWRWSCRPSPCTWLVGRPLRIETSSRAAASGSARRHCIARRGPRSPAHPRTPFQPRPLRRQLMLTATTVRLGTSPVEPERGDGPLVMTTRASGAGGRRRQPASAVAASHSTARAPPAHWLRLRRSEPRPGASYGQRRSEQMSGRRSRSHLRRTLTSTAA